MTECQRFTLAGEWLLGWGRTFRGFLCLGHLAQHIYPKMHIVGYQKTTKILFGRTNHLSMRAGMTSSFLSIQYLRGVSRKNGDS